MKPALIKPMKQEDDGPTLTFSVQSTAKSITAEMMTAPRLQAHLYTAPRLNASLATNED